MNITVYDSMRAAAAAYQKITHIGTLAANSCERRRGDKDKE